MLPGCPRHWDGVGSWARFQPVLGHRDGAAPSPDRRAYSPPSPALGPTAEAAQRALELQLQATASSHLPPRVQKEDDGELRQGGWTR